MPLTAECRYRDLALSAEYFKEAERFAYCQRHADGLFNRFEVIVFLLECLLI